MRAEAHYTTWNLWQTMRARGQSMSWLARSSGLSRSLLYRIKNGERPISDDAARRIASAMQLPLESLFLPVASTSGYDINNRSCERAAD
jgi:transcriptional regulator with XRE-family HTH domain